MITLTWAVSPDHAVATGGNYAAFLTPAWPFPLVVTYAESLFEFHLTDAASLVDPACKICFLLSDGRGNHCHTHLEGALPG